jgi:hypothetical protein
MRAEIKTRADGENEDAANNSMKRRLSFMPGSKKLRKTSRSYGPKK